MRQYFTMAVAVLAGAACTPAAKPPPVTGYGLASSRANYRAYSKQTTLCAAEPRWLFDELASVNNLLDRFLDDTLIRKDGTFSDMQILKLEEAVKTLPAVLDSHEKNLALLDGCAFATQRGFPILAKKGKVYARDARRRLEDAPAQVARVKQQKALAEWKDRVGREKVTLSLGCPRRSRTPIVYFAWQDEQGLTTWLFCDGSRVVSERGSDPAFEAPQSLTARQLRRLKASRYLSAAKHHPEGGVMRPPTGDTARATTDGL